MSSKEVLVPEKGFWYPDPGMIYSLESHMPNVFNGFKREDAVKMATSIPSNVMKRYQRMEDPLDFSESAWYNDSLSVDESTICAFEPGLHFDCHCHFSFGFIRPNVKGKETVHAGDFEFRVLKVTHLGWSERVDKYFYRDDFKDEDFETIWECLDSDEFWKLMYSGSQFDYLCEKAAGDLIECDDVDIMDLCKRAYDREHGQEGSL